MIGPMARHDDIQQRLQALEQYERAVSLRASGNLAAAREALAASIDLFPNLPQAQQLAEELGVGSQADPFAGIDPNDPQQLVAAIAQAQRHERWDQIPALAEALAALAPEHLPAVADAVDAACARLIADARTTNAHIARGWADAWARLTQHPAAVQAQRELQQQTRALEQAEAALRSALAAGDPAAIRQAVEPVEACPDRFETTAALVERAHAFITRRDAELRSVRQQLDAAVKADLLLACNLSRQLVELDDSETTRALRDDLHRRAQVVTDGEERLRRALGSNTLGDLRTALAALVNQPDRLADTNALITEAEARLGQLEAEAEELRNRFDGGPTGGKVPLPKRIRIVERLARIDPADERVQQLPKLRGRLQELHDREQHLEELIELGADPKEISVEADRLERRGEQVQSTVRIVSRARQVSTERQERSRRSRKRALILGCSFGVPAALALAIYLRDRSALAAIEQLPPSPERIAAARDYLEQTHLFGNGEARQLQKNTRLAMEAAAWQRATAPTDDARLAVSLRSFLDTHPQSAYAEQAQTWLAAVSHRLRADKLAEIKLIPDRVRRAAALADFLAEHRAAAAPELIAEAEAARAHIAGVLDEQAWAAVQEIDQPQRRLAAVRAYLERTDPVHAAEARELLAATEMHLAAAERDAADERTWQAALQKEDPRARAAAITDYLASTERDVHRAQAQRLLAELAEARDALAWARTQEGSPSDRLAAVRAYLAADDLPRRAHLAQAEQLVERLRKQLDTRLWEATAAADTVDAQRAAIAGYLENTEIGLYREQAQRRLDALDRREDERRWLAAASIADPVRRLTAIEGYLDREQTRYYEDEARRRLQATLAELERVPVAVAREFPLSILARFSTEALARFPDTALARLSGLPTSQLAELDPQILVRLPRETIRRLPVHVRARVTVHPPWATRAGTDRYGRWAEITLDDGAPPLRLRYVFAGALPDRAALFRGVWMLDGEVTRAQWAEVVSARSDPSAEDAPDDAPVTHVSWRHAQRFLERLRRHLDAEDRGWVIRLPQLAEFELVAHTVDTGPRSSEYPQPARLDRVFVDRAVGHAARSTGAPLRRSEHAADAWGMRGVLANLAEWVADAPEQAQEQHYAVGGDYTAAMDDCHPGARRVVADDARLGTLGFRFVIPAR